MIMLLCHACVPTSGQAKEEGDTTELATHILCTMVRGIFIKLEFPLAHFPTNGMYNYWYDSGIYCG